MKKKIFLPFLAIIMVVLSFCMVGCNNDGQLSLRRTKEIIVTNDLFENWTGVSVDENKYTSLGEEKVTVIFKDGKGASFNVIGNEIVNEVYIENGMAYNKTPKEKLEFELNTDLIIEEYLSKSYFYDLSRFFNEVFKNAKEYKLENGKKVVLNISTAKFIKEDVISENESDTGIFTYTFVFNDLGELTSYTFSSNSKKTGKLLVDTYFIELNYFNQNIETPEWFDLADYQ